MENSYLFLELTTLVMVYTFSHRAICWTGLFSRRGLVALLILAIGWFIADQTAINLGLWQFAPDGGSLGPLILSLPVEEYLLFVIHSLVCFMIIEVFDND